MYSPDVVILYKFLKDAPNDIKVKNIDQERILRSLTIQAEIELDNIIEILEYLYNGEDLFTIPFIIKQVTHQLDDILSYYIDREHSVSNGINIKGTYIKIKDHKIIQDSNFDKIKFSKRIISYNVYHKMRRKIIMYLFRRLNTMTTGFKQISKSQEFMNLKDYRNKKYNSLINRFFPNDNIAPSGYFDLSNGTFVVVNNREEFINKQESFNINNLISGHNSKFNPSLSKDI